MKRVIALPVQEYIKYQYEVEELSISEIANKTGISWPTVQKYAKREDWNEGFRIKERRCPVMEPYKEVIDLWLMEDALRPRKERRKASKIYKQLVDEKGFTGSERTVRDYVSKRKKTLAQTEQGKYLEQEYPPAFAQVDFGLAHVVYQGQICEVHGLVMSFPHSNGAYLYPLPAENTECFLHGLRAIFEHIGGAPQRIRFDNLSAAIVHVGSGENRELTDMFKRFMLHYRFQAEFCNKAAGHEKGHVENKVGYTRRNILADLIGMEDFEKLGELLFEKCEDDMNRNHYKKLIPIKELFEEDKKHLLPLPATPFEIVKFERASVNKYCKVRLMNRNYDVPTAMPGTKVLMKIYWDRVEILGSEQELLGTFPRYYDLNPKDIDWLSYFKIYARKPRGTLYSTMFKHMPEPIKEYLKSVENNTEELKQRINLIKELLTTSHFEDISEAILLAKTKSKQDETGIRNELAIIQEKSKPSPIYEPFTPVEIRSYDPSPELYNCLLVGGGDYGFAD